MLPLKIAVLGSGKGSNFRAILNAAMAGQLKIQPVLAGSDHAEAGLLALADNLGVPTCVIREEKFQTRLSEETEHRLVEDLRASGAELIVLAGWMRLVKAPLLEAFPRRIVNIHPSLLPAFPGLEAWKQALTFGALAEGPRLDPALMFGDVFKDIPAHLEAQRAELQAELYDEDGLPA